MNDEQLREHFTQWASPLRMTPPPEVGVIERRARRRAVRIAGAAASAAVTAALACLVIVAVVSTVAPNHGSEQIGIGRGKDRIGGGRHTAPPLQLPLASPKLPAPYMVVASTLAGADSAVVMDMSTNRVLRRVRPTVPAVFTAMAADQTDRLFVLAQQDENFVTSFTEIRLSAGATPHVQFGRLMPEVSLPKAYQVYDMTINPSGTRLAFSTIRDGGAGPVHLYVYDLETGALLTNLSEGNASVNLQYWPSDNELAFSWQAYSGSHGNGLRILNVAAASPAGESLLQASNLDSPVGSNTEWEFTADGSMALNVVQAGKTTVLQEYAAGSGQLLHTIPIGTAAALQTSPDICDVLWASANGGNVLTQCGTEQVQVIDGAAARVRLGRVFRSSPVGWVETLAW